MVKFKLKATIARSKYNTITKRLREEIFEWIPSHPNVNPSGVSSHVVMVLNQNQIKRNIFQKCQWIFC